MQDMLTKIYDCSMCAFTSSSDKGLKEHTTKSHTRYEFKFEKCD